MMLAPMLGLKCVKIGAEIYSKSRAATLSDMFGHLEASRSRFGLDVGVIWDSILDPQARSAILVKNSTAPRREHDFQRSGESQKTLQN